MSANLNNEKEDGLLLIYNTNYQANIEKVKLTV